MIDFSSAKSIVIPEGEVYTIACNGVILWRKVGIYTLENFTLGFVNSSNGAVEQNPSYPKAIVSPLIYLEKGKNYILNSDLSADAVDSGVRIRVYNANGNYDFSVNNNNLNSKYLSISNNKSNVYLATEISMEAKQDCNIRIMFLEPNYLTTAVFKEA